MNALPPSYAAWYAAERTRRFLFRPFNWVAFLRLCAVAVLTEGAVVSFRFTVSRGASAEAPPIDLAALSHAPGFYLFVALALVAAIALGLLFYNLIVRLRFSLFHCVVHQNDDLGSGWRSFSAQAERFFNGSLVVWFGILALFLVFAGMVAVSVFTVFNLRTEEGLFDPGVFLFVLIPCAGFALLLLLLAAAAEVVMHDFILPRMALDNLSFREAWRIVRLEIRAHREPFLSYFVLRIVLPLCAAVVLVPLGLFACWAVFGIVDASALGFRSMLEDATGIGAAARVAIEIFFAILAAAAGILLDTIFGGPLGIWIRSYAILFYRGYQPSLDNLLEPIPAEFLPPYRQ